MVASRVATLLASLRESQLLDAKQLAEVSASPLARGDDPLPLAKELVQRRGLTSFQVNQLLRGRGKALILGPYRLLDRLGEGGMGQVYKAFHQPMNRVVALKVIRKELLANPQAVNRFYQEVRAAAQLANPHVVIAYDAGQVGDTHFFAMEYVEGTDLSKLVKETGPLSVAQACDYVRQAALGLQHALERRLVHRDIKPANLLLDKHGTVKVLDLGLARLSGSADETQMAGLTETGAVVGTPHFLAPEQARNSHGVDIRADLYSLGCTLYYLLTGQPPFTGQELTEVLLKHQMDPFPSVTMFRKDVPVGAQTILQKLTAKKPEDRYQTPAELAAALAPFIDQSPDANAAQATAPAARGANARQLASLLRKKPWLLGIAALGLVLIVGIVGFLLSGPRNSGTPSTVGPTSSGAVTSRPQTPDIFAGLAKAVKDKRYTPTNIVGGGFDRDELVDIPPEGGLLIGFEVGLDRIVNFEYIVSLRPIYRTASGEKLGRQYGTTAARLVTQRAKKGYAVGGLHVGHALVFTGLAITYMKVGEQTLNRDESYQGAPIANLPDKPIKLAGNGSPVIGIVTKKNGEGKMTGLGLGPPRRGQVMAVSLPFLPESQIPTFLDPYQFQDRLGIVRFRPAGYNLTDGFVLPDRLPFGSIGGNIHVFSISHCVGIRRSDRAGGSDLGGGGLADPRGPSHELVPYRYDPRQWQTVPRKFLDDAPACTLYAGLTHLLEADGTIETITHEITRLSSRKALDKLGEYRGISYSPAYEKLMLNEARVLKADGRIVPVEAKHVQLRDVATDYQVYDTSKQLVISFPTLEVGDAIEVKWTVRGKNPEHGGQLFNRYIFGDDRYPVVCDELHLRLPKSKPLKHAALGGKLEPQIKEEGDYRIYHWQARNRPRLPPDDNLPPKEELRLQAAYSTFASWEEVFQWKRKLRKDCWKCTEELRKIVRDVAKDLKTPREKAAALTYWVRRHIRYISTGEKHDYTPHTPAQVLDNRFGDCKDTTQLLAVMLREAGVSVGLATLGVLDDGQVLEAVPSPWGTHAILRVRIDGKDHWIDTTVSLAGWDFLPKDDRDRLCYVVDEKSLALVRTPAMKPEENLIDQTDYLSIGADGSSRTERIAEYHGNAALARRHDWVEVPAGERRRLLTAELQDAQSQSRLVRLGLDGPSLKDFSAPVQARIVFEAAGHFNGDPDREGSLTDSPIWGKLLSYTLDFDRKAPLELGLPFESIHRYVIQLPAAYRLDSLPRDKEMVSKWGSFHLTTKLEGRRLVIDYRTRLEKTRVEPADFGAFRKFHEGVAKAYRVWLTLKPTHDPLDIPILETVHGLTPGDRDTAVILAGLYLREENPAQARRVLRGARFYLPDDVALAELAVKAAGTAAEEEAIYRELVRRFPGERKYAVALGRSLIDAEKPVPARAVLQSVVKNGNDIEKAQAEYQLARGFLLENKASEALAHWNAAAKIDDETVHTPAGLLLKGRIHEKLGQTKEAIEAYKDILELGELDGPGALDALVRLSLAAKQPAEALKYLRRYTVAAGDDPPSLAKAADYHLRLGRSDDALELAKQSLREEDSPPARRTRGLVRLQRGLYAEAAADLEKAGLDATVLEGRARCQLALGHFSQAMKLVEQADKVGTPTPDLLRVCALAVRLAQRRRVVAQEVRIPPGKAEAWNTAIDCFVCAEQAYVEGRPAAEVLEKAFADGVEIGAAYALRGLLALQKGRLTRALADAERAIVQAPKEARGYYVRGRAKLERGDKDALTDLTKAAELSERKDAAVLHWLAAAQFQAGRKADALATQREAVKLKPMDKEIASQLREFQM